MSKEIVYRKLSELKKLPNNPRTIKKDDMERLKKSIKDNPDYFEARPIILSNRTGELVILGGNQRYEAAKALGMDEVPTFLLEGLTDAREREIIIRDNVSNGEWNMDALANEWDTQELTDWGVDINWDEPAQEVVEDDAPEVSDEPADSVLGGIYQLGRHRLMCGDSINEEHIENLMSGVKADICFTSPPYNASSINKKGQDYTNPKYLNYNDNLKSDDYFAFISKNVSLMLKYSEEVFYNIGLVSGNKREIIMLQNQFIDYFKDIIYWKKNTVVPHIQPGVINNLVEFILCFGDGNRMFKNAQFHQGTYWNVIEGNNANGNEYASVHKATFPIYLPMNIVENFSQKDGAVLDCFGGTGTTLIACEQLGRKCYMMELEPKYCDVIRKRYWKFVTGSEEGWQDGTKAK